MNLLKITDILEHLETTLYDDIDKLNEKERTAFYLNVREYIDAKQQRTSFKQDSDVDTKFEITLYSTPKEVADGN